jgi:sugar phosphate isomerase/epimerase
VSTPDSRSDAPGDSAVTRRAPRLAFGSWAFTFGPYAGDPWSFARVCAYAAEAGYEGVEINGFRPHPHPDDYNSAAQYDRLRRLMQDAGVTPVAYAPDFTAVPPAEVRAPDYLATLDSAREFCQRLGITILRVDTVSPPASLAEHEFKRRFERLVGTWHEAARRCQQSGITLVWEFEPGFWLNRPRHVRQLVEAVNHPAFRILFDTCHAYAGAVTGARQGSDPEVLAGGVAEYATLLREYIGHVHLIDSDGSLHDAETTEHLPFGAGNVDFAGALRALEPELSRLEWWGIDFCFCPTTEADAKRAVPFVRSLVAQHREAAAG